MSDKSIDVLRHSAAHVMAAAVGELFPDAKFDIGPATEDGFYYDFELEHRLTPEDLERIQKKMNELRGRQLPFERKEMSRGEAEKLLTERGQTYKRERLADVPEGEAISVYQCGDFVDLCRGPHVEHTGQIGAFKLLSIAGSYYRGKETNPMLQRVYGTAFPNPKALKKRLKDLEEAKKRDHRRLGRELELYSVSERVGPGLILWHPKGARIRELVETFWRREHFKNGYDLIYTPHVGREELWRTSGHLDFYQDAMYSPIDVEGGDYYVKPMNCPFHIEIYNSRVRSYREFPLRWAELGTVYRYEKSGVLHGLLRVRGFTQDDAHIICAPEQIQDEIAEVLRFSLFMWDSFGFKDVKAYLSTRPEKAVGPDERWRRALESLRGAIEKVGLAHEIDEGGGAFYGPKIDLKIKDAIGREWQTSTIQFDFNLPERFDMTYVGTDGERHRPYMIHRALFGSLERFFGILIEHHAGAMPVWLAPEQIRILPISDAHLDYAETIGEKLRAAGLRAFVNQRPDTIGAKIKDARNERIPYMGVVGDREVENRTVSTRSRREGRVGEMGVDNLIEKLRSDIEEKR